MYKLFATDSFKEICETLDKSEKDWIDKIKGNLREYPTGKPLGFKWFREKKYLNKRLYFLVDDNEKKILLVSFASKKEQQEVINFVKLNMKELLYHLKNL